MSKKNRNALIDRLTYFPQAALLTLSGLLPYSARLSLGAAIGRTAVTRVPKLRRRIETNLTYVMPELGREDRDRIVRETGESFGRTFIELLNNAAFLDHKAWIDPTGPGADALKAAAQAGTGAILVTGHFGQWESGRAWMKQNGINCAGVYRPTDNPFLNARYLENLELGGSPMFAKGRTGVRGLVRHISKGGVAAVLTDQYDSSARRIDFLGKPAPTSFAVAELALRFGVPLLPAYGLREPDGETVRIIIEPPVPHSTPQEMMQHVNDSLSEQVRKWPAQYYWLHRRWEKDLPGFKGQSS